MRFLLLIMIVLCITGCETNQALRQIYYKYLDPPPSISLEPAQVPPQERELALAVLPIDEKITALTRFLAVYDKVSYDEWLRALASRFPWIQGAGIISPEGAVLFANPQGLFSQISFEPLLTLPTTGIKLQQKAMFLPVNAQDAFLFIGQPVFNGEELVEYRVVAVALSVLSSFTESSSKLYFIGNETVLWRGSQTNQDSIAFKTDWKKKEHSTVSGTLKNKTSSIEYIIIYIGPLPFIIALDVPHTT